MPKDTQLIPRRSTDIVLTPICLFYLQIPGIRVRSKSIIQTKSALELAQGIIELNYNQYIVIQIIFNQIIFDETHQYEFTSTRLQNPAATKRSYKNNYFSRK